MLLYCWGLIVEKNFYSYPEVLAILEIVENTGGKHFKKKKKKSKLELAEVETFPVGYIFHQG